MAKRFYYQDLALPPVQTTEVSDFTSIDWLVSGVSFPPPPPRRKIPYLIEPYILIQFQTVVPVPLPNDYLPNVGVDWVPPPPFDPSGMPFGEVQIQQADIPPLPLNGWFNVDHNLPVRRNRLSPSQHPFGSVAIPESLFTSPPAAPAYFGAPDLWKPTDGLSRPWRSTQEPFNAVAWIPTSLYGIPDYHPGYWYSDLNNRTRRTRHLLDQWSLVIPSSLYVSPIPLIFPLEPLAVPPPRKRPRPVFDLLAVPGSLPPYRFVGPDSLRIHLSGAASDGAVQTDQTDALGGYRGSELKRVGWIQTEGPYNLTIDQASAVNGADGATGSLETLDANTLRYTAPDSTTPGDAVYVAPGQSAVISDGEDRSKFVRVTRTDSDDMSGAASLEFDGTRENLIGMSEAEYTGQNNYRAVFFRNNADATITDLKVWVEPIPDAEVVTNILTPLVGVSTGSLQCGAESFISWPTSGWCRITKADGTLREVAYYFLRDEDELGFLAAGRGRLGSTASAGSSSDTLTCVPGIRIGWEWASPKANGSVQTIANETTAPSGVSWSTGISATAGVSVGTVLSQQQGVLWIHREIPSSATAISRAENCIRVQWTIEGVTYTERLSGLYRIHNASLDRYEVHLGAGSPPDVTATPTQTSTTLPFTISTALSPSLDYYVVVNKRNAYNDVSQAQASTVFRRDAGTGVNDDPPSDPQSVEWAASVGGRFTLNAYYFTAGDVLDLNGSAAADQWVYWTSFDGVDPNPATDTPQVVDMVISGGVAILQVTIDPYTAGTVGKVLIRTRRYGSADSTGTTVYSATAATAGSSAPSGTIHSQKIAEEVQ